MFDSQPAYRTANSRKDHQYLDSISSVSSVELVPWASSRNPRAGGVAIEREELSTYVPP